MNTDQTINLEYWRVRRQAGLAQSDLLPRAAELGSGINWLAISCLLIMGELFESLTPFTSLSLPAVGPTFLAGPPERIQFRDIRDLYWRMDEAVRSTTRLVPPELSTVMGLSGGQDSRHILLALHAEQHPLPRLVTARHFLGNLSETDISAARMLASRLHAPHQIVDQPSDRFRQEWDKNRKIGLQHLEHSWGLALAEALSGPPVLFDGMNGGGILRSTRISSIILQKNAGKQPAFSTSRQLVLSTLLDDSVSSLQSWAPAHLISPAVLQTLRDMLFASFSRYEFFPNPLQAFWHDQHVRRHTPLFTFGMMPNEVVVCPFDSPELVRFALSLPWEISFSRSFRREAIAHCYPDFADIPYGSELGEQPPTWTPDERRESASWGRIRSLLAPHLSQPGLDFLDRSRKQLGIIQRATLLSQAYYWDEHGALPDSAVIFDNSIAA